MKLQYLIRAVIAATILAVPLDVRTGLGGKPAPQATGFVAGISGKGYIQRNGETIMVSGMDLLYPGDGVRIPRGTRARITICGNRGYEIRGLAALKIRGRGIVFSSGRAQRTYAVDRKMCAAALDVFAKNEKKLPDMVPDGKKETLILRSRNRSLRLGVYVVRGRKGPQLIESFSNRLMPGRPFIGWTTVPGRTGYRVTITGGGETLWSGTTQKNSISYPESAPPLADGKSYGMSIEALAADGTVMARGNTTFSLYSREETESFRRDESSIRELLPDGDPGRHILLGKLYEAHGQLTDALASYEKALALDSGNAGLLERIGLLKNHLEMK